MKRITPILVLSILTFICSDFKRSSNSEELHALRSEPDTMKNLEVEKPSDTASQIATFLTFQENNAEEAMNFYITLFKNSKVTEIQRYGKEGPGKEGTVMVATFELNGSKFACSDSYIKHAWTFTPGVSVWVDCKTNNELENLFAKLSENGKVVMPLDNYGFSSKFAFIEDRFGVSWQLNLN